MPEPTAGMSVMVDMAGFSRGGVSMGQGASVSGTIVAVGPEGITVKLNATISGVDTVTVPPEKVSPA